MPHLALFSFSPGMTPEQQMALVRGEREPEVAAEPVAIEPEDTPVDGPAEVAPPKPRRRARTDRGSFRGDDPATPENEAYEPEREN